MGSQRDEQGALLPTIQIQEHLTPNSAGDSPSPTRPSVWDGAESRVTRWCLGEHTRRTGEVGHGQSLCSGAQDLGVGCGSAVGITPLQPERPELHLGLLQVENSVSKLGDASQRLPCWDTALMLPPLSNPQ